MVEKTLGKFIALYAILRTYANEMYRFRKLNNGCLNTRKK